MKYISAGLGAHTIASGNIVLTLVGWKYIRLDMRRISILPMHLLGANSSAG